MLKFKSIFLCLYFICSYDTLITAWDVAKNKDNSYLKVWENVLICIICSVLWIQLNSLYNSVDSLVTKWEKFLQLSRMAVYCLKGSCLGRNGSIHMAKEDDQHWAIFLVPEVNQEPQVLTRILKPLPKAHWSSGAILEIWKETAHMSPAGYTPFQYDDEKSLTEASAIIKIMKNYKDNISVLAEKENNIHI